MNLDATTTCAMAVPAMNGKRGQDARGTFSDGNIRNILGCELAAEVIRSSGKVRLRVVGSSMFPTFWPGDILSIERSGAAQPLPGDVVVFSRGERLITHRVVEVRRHDVQFKIQESKFGIPSPASRVPYPESRIEFVTRGDSAHQIDSPVSQHEVLGCVTSIQRGSRRFPPCQSIHSRMTSWVLSRSDFATMVVLKVGMWARGIQDTKFRIRKSRNGVQDLA